MHTEQLISLAAFIFVMVGTPGPNNVMLMASGVNFGVRRSVAHIGGITFGCQMLLLATAAGLSQVLVIVPQALDVLRVVGMLFLLYMAWLLAKSGKATEHTAPAARPFGFWQATLFQWANPKVWLICASLVATYTDASRLTITTAWASLVFLVVGTPLLVGWAVGGRLLQNWLSQGPRLAWFNRAMAGMLVATVVGMVV